MDLAMREIPEEILPHIETIKEVAKKYGIHEIDLYSFTEADLPWNTAILKLIYNLQEDIDENAFTDELVEKIGIATYLSNISKMSEPLRTYAIEEFQPL